VLGKIALGYSDVAQRPSSQRRLRSCRTSGPRAQRRRDARGSGGAYSG
jgi:hypothetical protein